MISPMCGEVCELARGFQRQVNMISPTCGSWHLGFQRQVNTISPMCGGGLRAGTWGFRDR